MQASVKLRGHHLLCILTYMGKGYTDDFITNFDAIIERINRGAPVEIISGIDSICSSLRRGAITACDHARICRKETVRNRDQLALYDIAAALRMPCIKSGQKLVMTRNKVERLRRYFSHKGIRRACTACPLHGLCTGIADSEFKDTKLKPASGSARA